MMMQHWPKQKKDGDATQIQAKGRLIMQHRPKQKQDGDATQTQAKVILVLLWAQLTKIPPLPTSVQPI